MFWIHHLLHLIWKSTSAPQSSSSVYPTTRTARGVWRVCAVTNIIIDDAISFRCSYTHLYTITFCYNVNPWTQLHHSWLTAGDTRRQQGFNYVCNIKEISSEIFVNPLIALRIPPPQASYINNLFLFCMCSVLSLDNSADCLDSFLLHLDFDAYAPMLLVYWVRPRYCMGKISMSPSQRPRRAGLGGWWGAGYHVESLIINYR